MPLTDRKEDPIFELAICCARHPLILMQTEAANCLTCSSHITHITHKKGARARLGQRITRITHKKGCVSHKSDTCSATGASKEPVGGLAGKTLATMGHVWAPVDKC